MTTTYATTRALADETAARKSADAALQAQVEALKAAVAALQPPPPVIVPVVKTVPVSSIPALLSTLLDDTVDEIVVADGTYAVPVANGGSSGALRIDSRYAARTRPVLVRASTDGGVVLSGGGANYWEGIWFLDGCHDQTWRGFQLANATVSGGGAIVFGQSGSYVPVGVRNIALQSMTVDATVRSGSGLVAPNDHAVYFSSSSTPSTGITIDDLTVDSPAGGVQSALHFYVQPALGVGPQGVAVNRMAVSGTDQAVMCYDDSLRGLAVNDSTIAGARVYAVRYQYPNATVALSRVASTGSGSKGLYVPAGVSTANLSMTGCSLA